MESSGSCGGMKLCKWEDFEARSTEKLFWIPVKWKKGAYFLTQVKAGFILVLYQMLAYIRRQAQAYAETPIVSILLNSFKILEARDMFIITW